MEQPNNIRLVYFPPVLTFGQGELSSPVTAHAISSFLLNVIGSTFFRLGIMAFGVKRNFRSGLFLLLHFQRGEAEAQSGGWLKVTQHNDNSSFLTS